MLRRGRQPKLAKVKRILPMGRPAASRLASSTAGFPSRIRPLAIENRLAVVDLACFLIVCMIPSERKAL
jgi:hypothetical protein